MQTIPWNESYSVGNADLDRQHKLLLSIINQLIEEQCDSFNEDNFHTAVQSLIHYAYTHFATEERYLLASNFPYSESHIRHHIDFIMKMMSLALGVKQGTDIQRKELLRYLKEWYGTHVLELDREYIPFLTKS